MSCSSHNCEQSCDPEDTVLKYLVCASFEYRTLDGSMNNQDNPTYGLLEQPFLRKSPAVYNNDDGCSLNDLNGTRPNPREVSNCVFDQPAPIPNSRNLSNMFWLWGQFIDHDITLTHTNSNDPANIAVFENP